MPFQHYHVFDLEGWAEIFMPFPKGWRRVVATQRHLTEGAAGKTTLHRLYCPTGSEHQAFAVWQQRGDCRGSGYSDKHYRASKSAGHAIKQANYVQIDNLFTRVLSSRSPRHLTCTFTWLLFRYIQLAIRCLGMTLYNILSLLSQHTTTKYLADKVFIPYKLTIVRLHYYSHMLSFGNGTYQPKTSERRHGWEISFKPTLLLVAEGVISTFFGDMPPLTK